MVIFLLKRISILYLPRFTGNMSNSIKNTLVVIAALILSGILIFLLESLIQSQLTSSHPALSNGEDATKVNTSHFSEGKLALILLIHAIGALFSGWIIAKFAASNIYFLALITGLIWTLFGVVNNVSITHPIWYSVADTCVFLPMSILGTKINIFRAK